jgi:hypothetical protein
MWYTLTPRSQGYRLFSHAADPGILSPLPERKARKTHPHKSSCRSPANVQCGAIIYDRLRRVEGQAFPVVPGRVLWVFGCSASLLCSQCRGLEITHSSAMAGRGSAAMIGVTEDVLNQQLDKRVARVPGLRASPEDRCGHRHMPGSLLSYSSDDNFTH